MTINNVLSYHIVQIALKRKDALMESRKIFEEIKNSMGEFPPFFPEYRNQEFTNCYAHALGLHYPDQEKRFYSPGKLTALYNGSDIFDDVYFEELVSYNGIKEHEIDNIIKCIKRDCHLLGLHAFESEFSTPSSSHSYKILLYTYPVFNGWHFVRESTTYEGKKIWTHKLGWYEPIQEVKIPEGRMSFSIDHVYFHFKRCLEIFF